MTSPYGAVAVPLTVQAAAPAVFRLGAARVQIVVMYGTGFGAVWEAEGALRRTVAPVTVRVGDVDLPVVYAGLTPGTVGLYQINVQLPRDKP